MFDQFCLKERKNKVKKEHFLFQLYLSIQPVQIQDNNAEKEII